MTKPSPTHFVSNISHQHQCKHLVLFLSWVSRIFFSLFDMFWCYCWIKIVFHFVWLKVNFERFVWFLDWTRPQIRVIDPYQTASHQHYLHIYLIWTLFARLILFRALDFVAPSFPNSGVTLSGIQKVQILNASRNLEKFAIFINLIKIFLIDIFVDFGFVPKINFCKSWVQVILDCRLNDVKNPFSLDLTSIRSTYINANAKDSNRNCYIDIREFANEIDIIFSAFDALQLQFFHSKIQVQPFAFIFTFTNSLLKTFGS